MFVIAVSANKLNNEMPKFFNNAHTALELKIELTIYIS